MPDHPGFTSRLFLSGSLAFVLIGIAGSLYGVVLPALTRAYDLEPGVAGLILTTHAMGGILSVLGSTLGLPGLTLRTGVTLLAIGAALIAAMPGWGPTLAASMLAGAGFGIIAVEVNRDFLSGFGPRGPSMVGLVNGISGLGLIAGPLLYVWAGGSVALVFAGMSVFALSLVFLVTVPIPSAKPAARGLPDFRQWRMVVLLLNLLFGCMEAALAGLGVSALIASGWSETGAAALASGFFTAFLVSRLSLYWLTRIIPPDVMFLIGAVGTALSAAIAATGWQATGYVMAGGFVALGFPSFYVWGTRLLGPDPRMGGAMLLSGITAGAVGSLLFGLLLHRIGLEQLFLSVAILGTIVSCAVAGFIGLARRARPVAAVPG